MLALVSIPQALPMTLRAGVVLSALIVVLSVIGLTMHRDFYAGRRRPGFFCFYTNLSNLLVLIYFALISPGLYARAPLRRLIPHADFLVTMCILLTALVFHLLLYPVVRSRVQSLPHTREYRIAWTDSLIEHYLVPWTVFACWLFCSPDKRSLGPSDAFCWTLIPLIYIGAIFLRARSGAVIAEAQSPYPYPFLDVRALGVRRVAATCIKLYALCLCAAIAVIAMTRLALWAV